MWLTENHVILPFQPLIVGLDRIERGKAFFGWEPELPIKLAIIPRDDLDAQICWVTVDVEAEYVLHTMSANERDGSIILDAPIYDTPPFPTEQSNPIGADYVPMSTTQMGRWTIDLSDGTVRSERVDDRAVEFPKVDERFYGKPYEWGFLMAGPEMWSLRTVVRRNVRTCKEDSYTIERDSPISVFEPTFAPQTPDAPEADGYLIVPISRFAEHLSEFMIFDTEDIAAGPVATIELPFQIGWTPHGHWMDL
jgi:carotenoid cleavage dioxygenase-like enzyme